MLVFWRHWEPEVLELRPRGVVPEASGRDEVDYIVGRLLTFFLIDKSWLTWAAN